MVPELVHGASRIDAVNSLNALGFPIYLAEREIDKALEHHQVVHSAAPLGAGPQAATVDAISAYVEATLRLLDQGGTVFPSPQLQHEEVSRTSGTSARMMPSEESGPITISQLQSLGTEGSWYLLQAMALHPNCTEGQLGLYTLLAGIESAFDQEDIRAREKLFLRRAVMAGAFDGVRLVLAARGFALGDPTRESSESSSGATESIRGRPRPPSTPTKVARQDSLDATYTCPISREIFVDPVTLACGHSFERHQAERVRQMQAVCPMCKEPIETQVLRVNIVLRDTVRRLYPDAVLSARRNELRAVRNGSLPTDEALEIILRIEADDGLPELRNEASMTLLAWVEENTNPRGSERALAAASSPAVMRALWRGFETNDSNTAGERILRAYGTLARDEALGTAARRSLLVASIASQVVNRVAERAVSFSKATGTWAAEPGQDTIRGEALSLLWELCAASNLSSEEVDSQIESLAQTDLWNSLPFLAADLDGDPKQVCEICSIYLLLIRRRVASWSGNYVAAGDCEDALAAPLGGVVRRFLDLYESPQASEPNIDALCSVLSLLREILFSISNNPLFSERSKSAIEIRHGTLMRVTNIFSRIAASAKAECSQIMSLLAETLLIHGFGPIGTRHGALGKKESCTLQEAIQVDKSVSSSTSLLKLKKNVCHNSN